MTRSLLLLRASVWLHAACSSSLAAQPAVTEALLAPLETAYLRAVVPGAEATRHRELFAMVLERVHRNYAREVDVPRLVDAALKSLESLEPE